MFASPQSVGGSGVMICMHKQKCGGESKSKDDKEASTLDVCSVAELLTCVTGF